MTYTRPGLSYWIVTFVTQRKIPYGSHITLHQTVPVQGKGPFRPGDALQLAARILGGEGRGGREQEWTYSIHIVHETTRADLEGLCVDFDLGRLMLDLDKCEGHGSPLTKGDV